MTTFLETLKLGFDNPDFSDYSLDIVHNNKLQKTIHVNSLVLATQSKFFSAMLVSKMREKIEKKIVLPVENESDVIIVNEALKLFYNESIEIKDNKIIFELIGFLHRIDAENFIENLTRKLNIHNIEDCNNILTNINSEILESEYCNNLRDNLADVLLKVEFADFNKDWLSAKFLKLHPTTLKIVLASDKLNVKTENTVYLATRQWMTESDFIKEFEADKKSSDYKKLLLSIFNCVRWEYLSNDFMFNIVRHDKLLFGVSDDVSLFFQKKIIDTTITNTLYHKMNYDNTGKTPQRKNYGMKDICQLVLSIDVPELRKMYHENDCKYMFTESQYLGGYYFRLQYAVSDKKFRIFVAVDTKKSLLEAKYLIRTESYFEISDNLRGDFYTYSNKSCDTYTDKINELGFFDTFKKPLEYILEKHVHDSKLKIRYSIDMNLI